MFTACWYTPAPKQHTEHGQHSVHYSWQNTVHCSCHGTSTHYLRWQQPLNALHLGACCTERCQHLHGTSAPAGKTSVCITCGLRRTCAQHYWRHGSMGPAQASRAVLLFSLCWGLQLRLDTTYLASSQPTKACQDHQGSLPARRRGGGLRNLRPLRMQQVAAVALSPAHQHPAQHTQAMAPTTTGDTPSSTACTVPLYLSGLDRSWHIHGNQPRHLNTAPRVAPACRTAQHSATHCTTYTCI